MSNFKVNGTDLDDLLMQSTNRHTNPTNFSISNNDIINKYGKWDNLERNKVAATRYTVANKDINEYFNKRDPTFQATLSGTFTFTGRAITPNIAVSPDSSTGYTITYNGNYINAASYLADASDCTLPLGYVWDSGYPRGSFTINAATLTGTVTNATLPFNGASQTRTVITGINAPASGYNGSPDATGTNGGTYTTSITGTGNYTGTVSGGILAIVQALITSQPTGGTANSGGSVTLSVTGSGAPSGGSISYQWYTSSGSTVSGAINSSYSASTSGDYYCTVTYIFNSVLHSINSNTVNVNITSPSPQNNNIIVYVQNVEDGRMQIGINSPLEGNYRIVLLDSQGSTIIQDLGKIYIPRININYCYKTYDRVNYSNRGNKDYQLRLIELCPVIINLHILKSENFDHINLFPNDPVVNFICIESFDTQYHDCSYGVPFLTLEDSDPLDPSNISNSSRNLVSNSNSSEAYLYTFKDNTNIRVNYQPFNGNEVEGNIGTSRAFNEFAIYTLYSFGQAGTYRITIDNTSTGTSLILTWTITSPPSVAPSVSPNTVSPETVSPNTVNTDPNDGGCLKYGTPLLMANNTWKNIEDLLIGDEVVSATIPTLPINEFPSYFDWWSTNSLDGMSRVTTTVANTSHKTALFYYKINDIIEVTDTHIVLAKKSDNIWKFYKILELDIGDRIIDDNDQETPIVTKERIDETINIVKLDVTTYDLFYTKGLLSHNLAEIK